MNPAQLLKHFDRISEAPDAVVRLRRFILDLAVRGKLVDQGPSDEPASELLRRIELEKTRLIKSESIPRQRPLPIIAATEENLSVPSGWVLTRLGTLSELVTSGSRDWAKHYANDGAIFIRMSNLSKESYQLRLDHIQHVRPPDNSEGARTRLETWDLLISITGDVGLLGLIPESFGEAYINQHTALVRPVKEMKGRYLAELFRSPFAQTQFNAPQRGIKNSFRLTDVTEFVVPLPPLAEQHRIVAKVDELMALCDRLEAAQNKREQRRDRLMIASLHQLQNQEGLTPRRQDAKEEREVDERKLGALAAWREPVFLQDIPRLTTRPEHIKALRQTILNLAVRGRLAPQDPNEEPIDATLRTALDRRAALVRNKKIRQKTIDDLAAITKSPDLPASWTVERLGNLVDPENTISYGVLVPGNQVADGIPFVRAQDLALNSHPERPNKSIAPEIEKAYARTRLQGGEILLCVVGSIGKLGVAPPSWAGANIARAVARILPIPEVFRDYLLIVLQAKPLQTHFTEATRTLAQPTLNVGLIEQAPIPLPPLAEQHRIVAKVDELMAVCDQLEANLATTQTDSRRLLEAVLRDALA